MFQSARIFFLSLPLSLKSHTHTYIYIRTHSTHTNTNRYLDKHLFIQALNYFGNLSLYDQNVILLSGYGVVQIIADHIDSKTFEEDVKLIAVKVLLNFSVSSEVVESETGDEDNTISMSIFTSGGAHAILALLQQFNENAGLVLNAVECLNNVCLERPAGVDMPGVAIVESLLPAGLLDTVLNLLRVYDYDEVIMEPTVELLASIVSSEKAKSNLVRSGVVQSLVSIVETHSSNEHILVNATIAFNILSADISLRKSLSDSGAVDSVLKFMLELPCDPDFVPEALSMLSRIASTDGENDSRTLEKGLGDQFRKDLTDDGMATVMGVVASNPNSTEILDAAFKLIGFLAFRKESIPTIVQMQGVDHIMNALDRHADEAKLMSRCMKTLEFIASEGDDFAEMVAEKGAVKRIRKVLKRHKKRSSIMEPGRAALVFLSAAENDGVPALASSKQDEITIGRDDLRGAPRGPAPEFPDDLF
jgi:hypothetical protein